MINDIKFGFKLMKHGLQFKTSMFCIVLFVVIGIGTEMSVSGFVGGNVYMMVGCVFIYQLVQSITCAGLVQTSPQKKRLQTIVPAVCTFVGATLVNTISIVVKLLVAPRNNASTSSMVLNILFSSACMICVLVYIATVNKMFWIPTMIFFVTLFVLGFLDGMLLAKGTSVNISLGMAIAISYLAVVVGSVLMYAVSLALYKKEFSKMAFESMLKRAK